MPSPTLDEVKSLAAERGEISATMIVEHYGVGYNAAAGFLERLEQECFITPANRDGWRLVLYREDGALSVPMLRKLFEAWEDHGEPTSPESHADWFADESCAPDPDSVSEPGPNTILGRLMRDRFSPPEPEPEPFREQVVHHHHHAPPASSGGCFDGLKAINRQGKARSLRNEMSSAQLDLSYAEKSGRINEIARARSRIARIESELRQLGA